MANPIDPSNVSLVEKIIAAIVAFLSTIGAANLIAKWMDRDKTRAEARLIEAQAGQVDSSSRVLEIDAVAKIARDTMGFADRFATELEGARRELANVKRDVSKLQSTIRRLEDENARHKRENEELKRMVGELESALNAARAEIGRLSESPA